MKQIKQFFLEGESPNLTGFRETCNNFLQTLNGFLVLL